MNSWLMTNDIKPVWKRRKWKKTNFNRKCTIL